MKNQHIQIKGLVMAYASITNIKMFTKKNYHVENE